MQKKSQVYYALSEQLDDDFLDSIINLTVLRCVEETVNKLLYEKEQYELARKEYHEALVYFHELL